MARGPFIDAGLPVYRLTLNSAPQYLKDDEGRIIYDDYGDPVIDGSAPATSVSILVHLEGTPAREVQRLGLDPNQMNITVLCADPMEGDVRIRHGSVCSVSPDFMGLKGALTIQGGPREDFEAVTESVGLELHAIFKEG